MSTNQPKRNKPRAQNAPSLILDKPEQDLLNSVLGRGCVSLATGVVQLYTADHPTRQRWTKRCCGVACFIKDNPARSYYIRVYDVKKGDLIWEQEIYNQFRYKTPRDYFHTFEADDAQAGLNFASEDEAHKFKSAIEQKLLERHKRRMDKKKQQSVRAPAPPPAANTTRNAPDTGPSLSASEVSLNKIGNNTMKSKKDKKDKKKKLTKEDISTPTDFRHVSHVGWDPNKGFDMNNLEPDMKDLFESVGINENDNVDKETIDFIYDFVEQHGGIDAVKKEMAVRPSPLLPPADTGRGPLPSAPAPQQSRAPPPPKMQPPPPARNNLPPPPPSRGNQGAPPPPPSRNAPKAAPPAPPPQQSKPPPPPMKAPAMAPPPPPPSAAQMPPPIGGAAPPPPPPPPPPPAAPAAPPPPPVGGGGSSMPPPPAPADGRSALLDQIRGGTSLRQAPEQAPSQAPTDARGDLLSAIRSGATLKHVEQTEERPVQQEAQGGIVGALARALANRQKHIQGSDDEDEDSDEDVSDDDEWED